MGHALVRRPRLALLAVAAAVLALSGRTAGPASASAQPVSACTTTSGVVLAVDFGHWGGPIVRACGTTPTTGYALLHQGGWKTSGTQHDGPAFICRIGYSGYDGGTQLPTIKQDKCVNTPPASAYWSYWHADPGQSTWSYSRLGSMSTHPKAGSVELWVFGRTSVGGTQGRPSISPKALRANNSTPAGTTKSSSGSTKKTSSSTHSASSPSTSSGSAHTSAAHSSTHSSTTSATPTAVSGTDPPSSSTNGGAAVTAGAGPTILDAQPVSSVASSAGSSAPALLGGVVVLGLAGAAGATAWRRRRSH